MRQDVRYRARWIVPVSSPPLEGGEVAVRDGRIVSVEPWAPAGAGPDVVDLGDSVLFPGFVNAHTHLDWSHRAGVATRVEGDFTDWVYDLISRPLPDRTVVESAARRSARSMAESGVSLVGDFCLSAATGASRLRAAGLGGVLFLELLHLQASRAAEMIRQSESLGVWEADADSFSSPRLSVAPAPHGPHTVSRELLEALAPGLARGGLLAIHLAESAAEREFVLTGEGPFRRLHENRGNWDGSWTPPGVSPVAYLDGLGLLTEATLAVHCVHVDAEDIERLARSGCSVAICPRSNEWTGAGRAPLPALLAAGIRCCLGTDSLASNADLDMASELAFARRSWPEIPAEVLVTMATLGGAAGLGRTGAGGFGEIAPGRAASLAKATIPPGTPQGGDPHAILCGDFGPIRCHRAGREGSL